MATINEQGNIVAYCPGCSGAKSTYEYAVGGKSLGCVRSVQKVGVCRDDLLIDYRLFRCAGCGRGGLGTIKMMNVHGSYPEDMWELLSFYPDSLPRLSLPEEVPHGIVAEFREAEDCRDAGCFRAGAALFRSVLDKTLREHGYKGDGRNLKQQIDLAASDGVITAARQRRAHDELRVLGNDVLHDEWKELTADDVELAHHYAQRILEDFYDDRASVLQLLKKTGRIKNNDIKAE